ncbi:hypothetical protein [Fervidobacterium gondwanense]|uniref:GLUG domain-containing protein n=1 Tax=Fervidobacterium gondwanense DSM 13020 TaxID=1121883 RepID=A0A1M7RXU6_FERGO|nr:hypothetical protein [Fervidobacterium gondwanense]SHN51000.1 hypothetical protein SAMN02745226_00307 [Fervidobacterium gondwanense DSM 13020]
MSRSKFFIFLAVLTTLLLVFSCVPQNQGGGGNGGGGTVKKDIYGWKLDILNSVNPDTGITIPEISGKVIYVSGTNAIISDATTAIYVYKANLSETDLGKKLTVRNTIGKTYSKFLEIDLTSGTKELSNDDTIIEPVLLDKSLDNEKETRALWDIRYAYVYGEFTGNNGQLTNTYEFKYPVNDGEYATISVFKSADIDAIYKPTTTTPATLVGYTKYYNDVWEFVVFPDKVEMELPQVTGVSAKYNPNSKTVTLGWSSEVNGASFNVYLTLEGATRTVLATTTTLTNVVLPVEATPTSVGIQVVKGVSKSKVLTISEIQIVSVDPVTDLNAKYDDYNGKMYLSWSHGSATEFKIYKKVSGAYELVGTTSDKSYSFGLTTSEYDNVKAIAVAPVVDGEEGPKEEVEKAEIGYTFAGGNGTESDPYLIGTVNQLKLLGDDNYRAKSYYFKLLEDLDLNGVAWTPIGTFSSTDLDNTAFKGVFDGNNKKIKNLAYNDSNRSNAGLFGYLLSSTVKNLILENFNITAKQYVGALAGAAKNSSVIRVGVRNSSITSTYSTGTSYPYAGGLIGDVTTDSTTQPMILRESFASNVTVTSNFSNSRTGVLVGRFFSTGTNVVGIIENCYATGTLTFVNGASNIGGLIGLASVSNNGQIKIVSSYAAVAPNGSSTNWRGFIGGASVSVTADSGKNYFDTTVSGTTTGSASSSLQIGKTTAEMKQQTTFVDWDFTNIWKIDEGNDYPRLKWEF